jgi:quercetin dioxygenase-like cupin family protein
MHKSVDGNTSSGLLGGNRHVFVGGLLSGVLLLGMIDDASALYAQEGPTREEYKTTAKVTELLRDDLAAVAGKEASIQALELAAGWVGDWHYHTVQEGDFVVDVEGQGRQVVRQGEVYHEALNTVMQARNGATGRATKLLFQVGGPEGGTFW